MLLGFAMSAAYGYFATPAHIAGFTVMYGIFLSLGEVSIPFLSPNPFSLKSVLVGRWDQESASVCLHPSPHLPPSVVSSTAA